jgi:tetratricopeptide (TPR) repeat protein
MMNRRMRIVGCAALCLSVSVCWGQGRYRTGGPSPEAQAKAAIVERETRCKKLITKAEKHMAKGAYSEAGEALQQASVIAITPELKEKLKEVGLSLHRVGEAQLSAADTLYSEGKYVQAVESYRTIRKQFPRFELSGLARRRLEVAKRNPKCVAALAEWEAKKTEQKLTDLLERNEKAKRRKDPGYSVPVGRAERIMELPEANRVSAWRLLELVVRLHPNTPQAREATQDMARLTRKPTFKKPPKAKAKTPPADAPAKLMKKAEMYAHSTATLGKAVEYYRQVIREYPKSKEALAARKQLQAWKKDMTAD